MISGHDERAARNYAGNIYKNIEAMTTLPHTYLRKLELPLVELYWVVAGIAYRSERGAALHRQIENIHPGQHGSERTFPIARAVVRVELPLLPSQVR